MVAVATEPLFEAIKAVLSTIPGYTVGDGRAPDPPDGEVEPERPYGILYSIAWDFDGGPPMTPETDAPVAFQVTTVGATAQQARFNADRVRKLLVEMSPSTGDYATPITVAGLHILGRRCVGAGGEDPDTKLTSIPERFVFDVSTAGA